jgi:hypothetical protein
MPTIEMNDVILPIIISVLLNVLLLVVIFWQRKYLVLAFKRVFSKGQGIEIMELNPQKLTIKHDIVKKIEDYSTDESFISKISSSAPSEATNPLEVPSTPYVRSETTGMAVQFFFKGNRKAWNPFSAVPFISDTTARKHNYLNVWNLRGLYDSTFAGSTFNKIMLAAMFVVALLCVGTIYTVNEVRDKNIIPIGQTADSSLSVVTENNTILKTVNPDWNGGPRGPSNPVPQKPNNTGG